MITECYIKGRFDYGVGKCAVVIKEDDVVHQAAWKVPQSWSYEGQTVEADQQNCEILAAVYALQWCKNNSKGLVNIYANTTTAQKWYYRIDFPDTRKVMAAAYKDAVESYYATLNRGETIDDRIFADYIPKDDTNEFNKLVNQLAEQVR